MGLLKLTDKYSSARLENACTLALRYTASPSYKNVKDILAAGRDKTLADNKKEDAEPNPYALTGARITTGGEENDKPDYCRQAPGNAAQRYV